MCNVIVATLDCRRTVVPGCSSDGGLGAADWAECMSECGCASTPSQLTELLLRFMAVVPFERIDTTGEGRRGARMPQERRDAHALVAPLRSPALPPHHLPPAAPCVTLPLHRFIHPRTPAPTSWASTVERASTFEEVSAASGSLITYLNLTSSTAEGATRRAACR